MWARFAKHVPNHAVLIEVQSSHVEEAYACVPHLKRVCDVGIQPLSAEEHRFLLTTQPV